MIAESTSSSITKPFWQTRLFIVALIVLSSLLVHAWAIYRLPEDNDEPTYLRAGADYAEAIRAGDVQKVIDYPNNTEHPPLVKLIYSIPFISGQVAKDSLWARTFDRSISALFGTLTVALVAWIDPLAGLLLVFHSIFTKYTSLVMLDALPALMSLAAVLALTRYNAENQRWLWISAAALGLTVAGKYTFAVVTIPILVIFLRQRNIPFKQIILYGLVALLVFWAANPALWHDPIGRLLNTVSYHASYSHGEDVARANYPWYQPIIWLTTIVPLHPSVRLYPSLDPLISGAALIGLYLERKQRPWLVAWVIAGLAILLLWSTKWPHYTLIISAPLCLLAATTLRTMALWVIRQAKRRRSN